MKPTTTPDPASLTERQRLVLTFIEAHIRQVNPRTAVFRLSATTGEGFEVWHDWLDAQRQAVQTSPTLIHA